MHTDPLFAGGGQMGALIRQYDWTQTPLGEPSAWPQSLRSAINIMMNTTFGMYIAWGPDFIQFYNDSYRPILGDTKHPALGKSTRETFQEVWHILEPLFDSAMSGNSVGSENWCLPLDRNGFFEECYFTFSYSPIVREEGDVGGVLVIVVETTKTVLQARRLTSSRELASKVQSAKSIDEIWQAAKTVLEKNPQDLPFIHLAPYHQSCQIDVNPIPDNVSAEGQKLIKESWLKTKLVSKTVSTNIQVGDWSKTVAKLIAIPIQGNSDSQYFGTLLLGLSPYLEFDADYRSYLVTLAQEIGLAINIVSSVQTERQRTQKLEALSQAKSAFISNISDELLTPLSLMTLPLDELKSTSTAEQQPLIDVARHNSRRLSRLVNNLLHFTQVQSRGASPCFMRTQLASFTQDLANHFKPVMAKAGLRFKLHISELSRPVYVDHSMWEQIVLNLLSNAFKFTLTGEINVTLAAEKHEAVFCVEDTGIGIDKNNQQGIFEQFNRIEHTDGRRFEGIGVGLSMVKQYVELHAGKIICDSRLGEGSKFSLRLPFGYQHLPYEKVNHTESRPIPSQWAKQLVDESQRWLHSQQVSIENNQHSTFKQNILVVENNLDMQHILNKLLSPLYNLYFVSDGKAALSILKKKSIDLVLCGCINSLMSNAKFFGNIRNVETKSRIPLIVITVRSDLNSSKSILPFRADDYIVKPFRAPELLSSIKQQIILAGLSHEVAEQAEIINKQNKRLVANENLHKNQSLLTAIFDFAPVGITVANLAGNYVEVNRTFEKISGYTKSAALDVSLKTLSTPKDWEKHRQLRHQLMTKKIDQFTLIKNLQRFDGTSVWTRHTVAPIVDLDGYVSHTVALVEDISGEVFSKTKIHLLSERSLFLSELGLRALKEKNLENIFTFCVDKMSNYLQAVGIGLFLQNKKQEDYFLSNGTGLFKNKNLPMFISTTELNAMTQGDLAHNNIKTFIQTKDHCHAQFRTFFERISSLQKDKLADSVLSGTVFVLNDCYGVVTVVADNQYTFNEEDANFVHACCTMLSALIERSTSLKNLADNRELLTQAQEVAGLAYFEIDILTGRSKWSDNLTEVLGLPSETKDITIQAGLNRVHEDDRSRVNKIMLNLSQNGGEAEFTCRFIGANNIERIIQIQCIGIRGEDNQVSHLLATCLNVTERKRHEQKLIDYTHKLKELSQKLVLAQEDERKRLAIELHDQVGQNLTALSLSVSTLDQMLASPSTKISDKLSDIHTILEATNLSIEHILNDIRPPLLADWGLKSAIEWYVRNFKSHYGINVVINQTNNSYSITKEAETAIYRALQEALNNAIKHSDASEVEIKLLWGTEHLAVDIVDNGKGMEVSLMSKNTGFGLTTMRERIEGVGGCFFIQSEPGEGTRVHFGLDYKL